MKPKLPAPIGLRSGRLEVVGDAPDRNGQRYYACICDCGNATENNAQNIKRGLAKSCGCLLAESRRRPKPSARTHGQKGTPEYRAWQHMKNRCCNPNDKKFYLYGGRGITVCAEWMHSFEAFFAHIGPRPGGPSDAPRSTYSLDRIDGKRGYEPGNVRWATIHEQNANRRPRSEWKYAR